MDKNEIISKVEKEIVYEKELNINFSNRELVIIDNKTLLNEQKEYLTNYKKIASIGPMTSETIRRLGMKVDYEAEKYTADGILDEIFGA